MTTLALLSLLALQDGAGWPQWLGANRDNRSTETGLLQKWPSGGPKRAWATSAVGEGFGGVSVAGGKVFLLGDLADASYLFALNEKDGKTAWKVKVGPPKNHANKDWNGPRSTPTVDGDRVYAMGEAGDLVCVEAASGKDVWRKNMVKDLGGEAPKWLYCDSPLIDGKNVIVKPGGSKGALAALDKATGAEVWRSRDLTDPVEHTSLMPAEIGGARQYVVFTMKSVAGVAPDGQVLWRADRPGDVAICSTAVVKDDIVLVASSYSTGRATAFKVAGSKAEKLYDADLANHHGGLVVVGDHVYGTGDRKKGTDRKNADLKCMEIKTGKIVWENESIGKGSITYADGHLIVRSENPKTGGIALVEASPEGYKEKGRFALPDQTGRNSWAYPVVAHGRLFIRNGEGLYAFELKAK
jgi:outer membrane protein assembly factor BamB